MGEMPATHFYRIFVAGIVPATNRVRCPQLIFITSLFRRPSLLHDSRMQRLKIRKAHILTACAACNSQVACNGSQVPHCIPFPLPGSHMGSKPRAATNQFKRAKPTKCSSDGNGYNLYDVIFFFLPPRCYLYTPPQSPTCLIFVSFPRPEYFNLNYSTRWPASGLI